MIITAFTAAAVYVATGIDYLVILILLFSQIKKSNQIKHIWIGQYIGTDCSLFLNKRHFVTVV